MSRTLFALAASAILAAGVVTAAPKADAIAQLQPGQWTLRDLDGGPSESICLADPSALLQIQHRAAPCTRMVLASDAHGATVHYTCPANGFGRTALRVQTPRVAKIDTQGIADSIPFAQRLEARRTGDCGGGGQKLRAR